MRPHPRLGLVNFALVSAYFVPVWGHEALRVLTSPFGGFEDRTHAVVAIYIRNLFDFGLVGLIRTSQMLAVLKMMVAAAFIAYLIEFARALATRQDPSRETVDIVLTLALATVLIWVPPTLASGDAGLIRLLATQFLLLVGAAIIIVIERQAATRPRATEVTAAASPPERSQSGAAPAYP
ncbi:MAG TPA: hypothetical protein VKW08_00675 [Xanthobacteraceae bacterium]|jgi:hypothetical protein|nr:hypothetical protein [Xanthobacteraceae bacterium]